MNQNFKRRLKTRDKTPEEEKELNAFGDEESSNDQNDVIAGLVGNGDSPLNTDEDEISSMMGKTQSEELTLDHSDEESGGDDEKTTYTQDEVVELAQDYENQLEEKNQSIVSLQNSIKEYDDTLDALQKELDQNNNSKQEVQDLQNQLNKLKETNVGLEKQLNEYNIKEEQFKDYEVQNGQFRHTIEELKQQILSLKNNSNDQDKNQIIELQKQIESYKSKFSEFEEKENEYDQIKDELSNKNSQIKLLSSQLENGRKEFDAYQSKTQEKIDGLQKELAEKDSFIQELQNQQGQYNVSYKEELSEDSDEENSNEEIIEYNGKSYTDEDMKAIIKRRGPKTTEEHKLIDLYIDYQKNKGLDDPEGIPDKIFEYVCNQTIKALIGGYQSEMYSKAYSDKLLGKYVDGEVDFNDPLFKALINEIFESETIDEYLGEELSKGIFAYIGHLYP